MSYEGYNQYLCKNGHYWTLDAMDTRCCFLEDCEIKCPHCNEEVIWSNIVNTTNGSYYEDERVDGYVELEKIDEGQQAIECPKCGHKQEFEPPRYEIPQERISINDCEIQKTIVLNAWHLRESDADILETSRSDLCYDYGWRVYAGGTHEMWDGMSEEFFNILTIAQDLGCDYVCFDRDGEVCKDLPYFEWWEQ